MPVTRLLFPSVLLFTMLVIAACSQNNSAYKQGRKPGVSISGVNTGEVKKYEKFEMVLDLKNVKWKNPYDPADIDISAEFSSPSGEIYRVFGFFDDYKGAGKWKIRFSPSETGIYKYQVFIKDGTATGQSDTASFEAVDSPHHGWIKQADSNPHYFSYHDGTSYYAVGVYSPWGNNAEVFKTFRENKANFFAIWDIPYGGFVNDAGIIEDSLGYYNQEKLGQIDSLLTILENDNVEMMFAIWPHDLFSETVWSAQWKINPYSKITSAENVYGDSLAWAYQKMKYRYLIARFAHSRSWGIWELINEMDGTDGWAKGHHDEAYTWVDKCVRFFHENDPYRHPVTASFSGGFEQYREPLYRLTDVPNIHVYPAQGWIPKYPADSIRSDMYNFAWASRRFTDRFEKPSIFGEAGADLTYFKPGSPEYHISYHNQIWASLANGLAGTPVWWAYDIMKGEDWEQLKHLSEFAAVLDISRLPYKPAEAEAAGADVYVMDGGTSAFGWLRVYDRAPGGSKKITIRKTGTGTFNVSWYDCWTGKTVKTENASCTDGRMTLYAPLNGLGHPDIAFRISSL